MNYLVVALMIVLVVVSGCACEPIPVDTPPSPPPLPACGGYVSQHGAVCVEEKEGIINESNIRG